MTATRLPDMVPAPVSDATDADDTLRLTAPIPTGLPSEERAVLPSGRRIRPRTRAGTSLVVLGTVVLVFLGYLFGFGALAHSRAQQQLLAELQSQFVTGVDPPQGELLAAPAAGSAVGLLQIPALGVEEVIVEGTTSELLARGPGHLRSSVLPGQLGNSVIAGRRTTFGSPFARLGELPEGSEITVTTEVGEFRYEVSRVSVIRPGEVDALNELNDARLTLMTSHPAYAASSRLVAIAALAEPPVRPYRERPLTVEARESGLTGDAGGVLPLLVWLEALVLVAVAGRFAARRWTPAMVYLLLVPPGLVFSMLAFESLQRLLPATL